MTIPVKERVRRRRAALRAGGLRPVQVWVPDSRRPGFAETCRSQSLRIAVADLEDRALAGFLDANLEDIAGSEL